MNWWPVSSVVYLSLGYFAIEFVWLAEKKAVEALEGKITPTLRHALYLAFLIGWPIILIWAVSASLRDRKGNKR